MRITRIDFEGPIGRFATAKRRRVGGGCDHIEVTILTPNQPEGREHEVQAACEEDIFSMAECLQHHLDGYDGSNSEVNEYHQQLLRLSDI